MITKVLIISLVFASVSFARILENTKGTDTNETKATEILESIEIQRKHKELIIKFEAFDIKFHLKLMKANAPSNKVLSEDINGNLIEEESKTLPIFIDEETGSSIILNENIEDGTFSIEGTIGDDLMIHPMKSDTQNKHIVTKVNLEDLASDYLKNISFIPNIQL